MKNQYVGDIGDYGKYGMLRFFARASIKVGVNWYLCPDDEKNDGNHTEYLSDDRMRVYDEDVYDALKGLAFRDDKTVQMVEKNGILDGILFYNRVLDLDSVHWSERTEKRNTWHREALDALKGADMVFADPDNSLTTKKKPSQRGTEKFILSNEVTDYYNRGQEVVYYHHRSRKNDEGWMQKKIQMRKFLPDAQIMAVAFKRWSRRVYIFVVHKDKGRFLQAAHRRFYGNCVGDT